MQIVNSKLKYFNMITLDMLSDLSSVESEFCIEENFVIKLARVSISYVAFVIKPKRAAILFYKKVVPFNLGFDSLGNE